MDVRTLVGTKARAARAAARSLALCPTPIKNEALVQMARGLEEKTAALLEQVAKNRAVLVVEHDMQFVESIADTVTVLHQGKLLAEGKMAVVKNDPKVIDVYLGH